MPSHCCNDNTGKPLLSLHRKSQKENKSPLKLANTCAASERTPFSWGLLWARPLGCVCLRWAAEALTSARSHATGRQMAIQTAPLPLTPFFLQLHFVSLFGVPCKLKISISKLVNSADTSHLCIKCTSQVFQMPRQPAVSSNSN